MADPIRQTNNSQDFTVQEILRTATSSQPLSQNRFIANPLAPAAIALLAQQAKNSSNYNDEALIKGQTFAQSLSSEFYSNRNRIAPQLLLTLSEQEREFVEAARHNQNLHGNNEKVQESANAVALIPFPAARTGTALLKEASQLASTFFQQTARNPWDPIGTGLSQERYQHIEDQLKTINETLALPRMMESPFFNEPRWRADALTNIEAFDQVRAEKILAASRSIAGTILSAYINDPNFKNPESFHEHLVLGETDQVLGATDRAILGNAITASEQASKVLKMADALVEKARDPKITNQELHEAHQALRNEYLKLDPILRGSGLLSSQDYLTANFERLAQQRTRLAPEQLQTLINQTAEELRAAVIKENQEARQQEESKQSRQGKENDKISDLPIAMRYLRELEKKFSSTSRQQSKGITPWKPLKLH
jgi:hypothetical protein